jgi:hypothetical protein
LADYSAGTRKGNATKLGDRQTVRLADHLATRRDGNRAARNLLLQAFPRSRRPVDSRVDRPLHVWEIDSCAPGGIGEVIRLFRRSLSARWR